MLITHHIRGNSIRPQIYAPFQVDYRVEAGAFQVQRHLLAPYAMMTYDHFFSVSVEPVPDRPTVVMVLEAFARSLLTGAPVPVSGEDGLRAVVMADACYRAAREGRPVPVILTA